MEYLDSWVRHLRARRRSAGTVASYRADVRLLFDLIGDVGVADVSERDIERFLVSDLQRDRSLATVVRRRRSLHQFFRWLAERGAIEHNPVVAAAMPPISESAPDVLTDREMGALLGACGVTRTRSRSGKFEARRDTAIVLLLMTTGMRASELIGLTVDDIDLESETARVFGRQRVERSVALMRLPVTALQAYLIARDDHRLAQASMSLWLGEKGPLTDSGLRQMLERRCRLADIRYVTPHVFRRTYAHEAMRRGATHGTLMIAGGWATEQMLRRYAPVAVPSPDG